MMEEEVIDQLFISCVSETGQEKVEVQTVLDYLKLLVKRDSKSRSNEPDLVELENILNSHSEDGFVDIVRFRKALKQWISQIRNRSESTSFLASVSESDRMNLSNNSSDISVFFEVPASQGDSAFSNSKDDCELLNDLKFKNKQLLEENVKLQGQLESQEETLAALAKQLERKAKEEEHMRKKIESLQDQIALGEMVLEENEVLKTKLDTLQEVKRDLDMKVNNLEQENAILDKQAWGFENKWQKSLHEMDLLKKDLEELQYSFLEKKDKRGQVPHVTFADQNQSTDNTDTPGQSLNCDKHDSLGELQVHKRSAILPAYMSTWEFSTGSTADFPVEQEKKLQEKIDGLLKENEKLKGEKEEAEIKLAESQLKLQRFDDQEPTCSTPLPLSIYMELKDRLNEDKHLPSPLCEKDKMSELLFLRKSLMPISARELDFWSDTSLDNSLEQLLDNTPSPFPSMTRSLMDVFNSLFSSLEHNMLKLQITSPLKPAELEIEKKLQSLKTLGQSGLQEELIKLYRVNLDLAEKCHKAELRETELQEQVKINSQIIEQEKQRHGQLEESLTNSILSRSVELKDLWRLVHSPEEEDDSVESDSSLSASTEILKQQIKQDIEALKEKLRKRDSVIQSMRKSVPRPNFRNKGRPPPSSLVDALTIEHIPAADSFGCPNSLSIQTECKDCNRNQAKHSQSLYIHNNNNRSVPLLRKHIMETNSVYNNNVVAVKNKLNVTQNRLNDQESKDKPLNTNHIADKGDVIEDDLIKLDNERKSSSMNNNRIKMTEETINGPGALVRRNSYVNAIENESCPVGELDKPRLRSDSFQSAIEQGHTNDHTSAHSISLSSSVIDTTPENESSDSVHWVKVPKYASTPLPVISKPSVKSVNFCPKVFVKDDSVDIPDEISDISNSVNSKSDSLNSDGTSQNSSVLFNSSAYQVENAFDREKGRKKQNNHVNRPSHKELSMLVEEDLPCVCCESDTEISELVFPLSDRHSPHSEDFSPEVWTLNSSSLGSSGHSATSSEESEGGQPVIPVRSESEKPKSKSAENLNKESPVYNKSEIRDNKTDIDIVQVEGVIDEIPNRDGVDVSVDSAILTNHSESTMDDLIERTRNMKLSNSSSAISESELVPVDSTDNLQAESELVPGDSADNLQAESDANVKLVNIDVENKGAIPGDGTNILQPDVDADVKPVNTNVEKKETIPGYDINNLQVEGGDNVTAVNAHVENIYNEKVTDAVTVKVPIIEEPTSAPVIRYELKSPPKRVTVRSDSDELGGKSKFLHSPDQRHVLVPLVAISPLPSPPQSPCINFFQSREKMKGPKGEQIGEESEMTEQNNNKTESLAVDKTDVMCEEDDIPRTASYLVRLRETHLAKRRDQLRQSKMPELSELSEKDGGDYINKSTTNNTESDVIQPPEPNGDILPSIPTEFLEKLGLSSDDINSDELSDQEIESKFASLSLAFKTDAQTLEKRLEIQERSRDIAEQNVDKELQCLRTALAKLNEICTDPQVRELLSKIQNHIEILEKASARVSSRAEVFGAIQQEKRLSKAVDIMVHHVQNIHRVHEKEHAELQEARKLLQDSRSLGPSALDITGVDVLSRRSASVCPNNISLGGKPRRRISEIALPKVLGGSGAPNLHPSPSMGNISQPVQNDTSDSIGRTLEKDPRSRFQAVVASTTVKSAITNNLRKASYEKQNKESTPSPTNNDTPQASRTNSIDSTKDEKQKNLEEEAFKRGYEQGMRASLGQDLSSLREQQNQINESLGDIMDNMDNSMDEPKGLREILQERFQDVFPKIQISSWRIRITMSCFFVIMAILSILVSLFPANSAEVINYRNVGYPPL